MKYFLGIIFLMVVGCSASKYFSSKGEELYYEKCGGCHRLYPKSEYKSGEWKKKMDEMAKRAKLNNEENKIILSYLTE